MSGSGNDLELDSTRNYEVVILTSPLSMAWWLSIPMIADITGLVLEGEVLDLKWADGVWLFHSISGSFGSSPWSALNLFIFILRLGGRNIGPHMIQGSYLCPILPHNSQILFCLVRRYSITEWRVDASLLMEDEGLKLWEIWTEVVNIVGVTIISRQY